MRRGDAMNGFILTGRGSPIGGRELARLLVSGRSRQALRGLMMLRRAYDHVFVMATVEGVRPIRRPYYEAYVDALNILAAKATLIARAL
jgi:hypothetical protein